jgi:hypothetical protein
MMDNLTNMTTNTAEAADAANKVNETATEFGKFKDVEALLTAYKNLEAEFTRRSMKLKELEGKAVGQTLTNNAQEATPVTGANADAHLAKEWTTEEILQAATKNDEVKNAIIGEYVKAVAAQKSVPLMTGGTKVAAVRNTPKTIKEAGALALQHLRQ